MARRRCDCCGRPGRDRFYCNHCRLIFCNGCWDQQITHKQQVDAVHEKTAIELFEMLRDCLRPNRTEDEQKRLHQVDESTTWFGVTADETEQKVFQDYGRFGELMQLLSGNRTHDIFPAIVSFVGNTGAGKSTLIKILIKLHARPGFDHQTPVVGTLDACNLPSSGDVHLYFDPKSVGQNHPIVYADSEGLEAGEVEPTAIQERVSEGASGSGSRNRSYRQQRRIRKAHYGSERLISWATSAEKRSRRFAVTNVYPRILYTFSDVVVFVIKNGREFENAAIHLLSWAEKAIEQSSNQPVLPHAIIAVNEAAVNLADRHWSIEDATWGLFRDYHNIIPGNPYLDRYVQDCRRRGKKIRNLEELLLMYYSSVRVIKIPEIGHPNLMEQQMRKLYAEIDNSCKKSHGAKKALRMLFTATELNSYLQHALDHFAATLDEPFDFIQALSINSPSPQDFGGNIMNLAMKILRRTDDKVPVTNIFQELSYVIASCIMLDIARNGKRGPNKNLFAEYLTQCDDALETFCDRGWPCEFRKGEHRCVNVRVGHSTAKGHQRKNGMLIGAGDYVSDFSVSQFRPKFRNQIYALFEQSMDELNKAIKDRASESQIAANLQKRVLRQFFYHIGGARNFKSNFTCFACLMELPEHPLSCGHVLCTPCVKSYSHERAKNLFEVRSCPLEHNTTFNPIFIMLKPRNCGVRVLSLDGGGVRAIAELEILRALRSKLGGKIPIQAFFDLIVGTDMGGILALDLAAEKATSPSWCNSGARGFKQFCINIFERSGFDSMFAIFYPVLYKTVPLKTQSRRRFGDDPFFGWNPSLVAPQIKVALISSLTTGAPCVIANYNRSRLYNSHYTFDRPENPREELKNWEVARAVLAVPRIFESFTSYTTHRTYQGASVDYINPISIADRERKVIWPDVYDTAPDIMISIGTGLIRDNETQPSTLRKLLGTTKKRSRSALDSKYCSAFAEKLWNEYCDSAVPNSLDEGRFIRLNVFDENLLDFDSADRMNSQQDYIRAMKGSIDFERLAQRLIASCFYFEVTEQTDQPSLLPDHTLKFSGSFHCRLSESNIKSLGDYFRRKLPDSLPCFIVKERGSAGQFTEYCFDGDVIDRMLQRQQFNIGLPEISVSQITAIVEIEMRFGSGNSFPISGFPRPLCRENMSVRGQRRHWGPNLSLLVGEGSEEHTREEWTGPTASETLPYSLLEYCEASYLLGGQSKTLSNVPELPAALGHRRRRGTVASEALPTLLNPSGRSELPSVGPRPASSPELSNPRQPPTGTSELPGSSSGAANPAKLPHRASTRHRERDGRAKSPGPADAAELPGDQPTRHQRNRRSGTSSSRSRLNRSTTEPISQPPRQGSTSRRHSEQSTDPRTSTSRRRSPTSNQRHESEQSDLPDEDRSRKRDRRASRA